MNCGAGVLARGAGFKPALTRAIEASCVKERANMSEPVIFKNVFLIDGRGGEPVPDAAVVVAEKRFRRFWGLERKAEYRMPGSST